MRIFTHIENYILKSRPYDVQNAMLVGSSVGGIIGVSQGFYIANQSENGYLWRPLFYGSIGIGSGIVAGVHYKKVAFVLISIDIIKTIFS